MTKACGSATMRTTKTSSLAALSHLSQILLKNRWSCYYFYTVILLLTIASRINLANSLVETSKIPIAVAQTTTNSTTGFPTATTITETTTNTDISDQITGSHLSSTGERQASMNDSSNVPKEQQMPKSLEFLLRSSSSPANKWDNEFNNVNVNTISSQVNVTETSQRANTNVVVSTNSLPLPVAVTTTTKPTTTATTLTKATVSGAQQANSQQQSSSPPQVATTKSLKFTLIAGKAWKFIIKGSGLSNLRGAELRLHKNVSMNNYIIDDEGWFQYNPQQQQLLAWPSLATKSGTYYFVLLPSGIDFEADSENVVNLEVAASIVVELIKPVISSTGTKLIDQLIDHEFSLEYLHRHPTYPLLVNQIFSVFETLAKSSNNQSVLSTTTTTTSSLLTTISPNQQVASRSSNRLGEYLLLNSAYSSDGELFTVTWSTHPTLLNNTIIPTSECRLNTIIDTITKLSSLSAYQQSDDDKFSILYTLEAAQSSSQAIVPTERSNALKLTLNGPCQKAKIIEELGIIQPQVIGKLAGAALSAAENNENNVVVADNKSESSTASTINSLSDPPISTSTITSSTNYTPGQNQSIVTSTANQITSTETSPIDSSSPVQINQKDTTTVLPTQVARSISHENDGSYSVPEVSPTPPVSNPPIIVTELPVIRTSNTPIQQPKVQPQAKSLQDFLEMSDVQQPPQTTQTTSGSPELSPTTQQHNLSSSINDIETTTISGGVSVVPTKTVTPVSAESTLNEDFMGILDEVMNYLISVAVPVSIIVGTILLLSIMFALCHLYRRRKKSQEFKVRNRFDFRYGSERKVFLKNCSRPVILEADQKSLSMGGTPQHNVKSKFKETTKVVGKPHYLPMSTTYFSSGDSTGIDCSSAGVIVTDCGGFGGIDCGGYSGGDGGGGGDCGGGGD